MNSEEQLDCREVLPNSLIATSWGSRQSHNRNECLLMQPFAQADFLSLRRSDGASFNYSTNVSFYTWERPETMGEFMGDPNNGVILNHHPLSLMSTDLSSTNKASNGNTDSFVETKSSFNNVSKVSDDSYYQEATVSDHHSTFDKKLPSSKYSLPSRARLLRKGTLTRPKENFTYTPSSLSFYSDMLPSSAFLPLSPVNMAKSGPLTTSTAPTTVRPLTKTRDTKQKYYPHRNHVLSYSWDILQLGTRLGTPALNSFRKHQQNLDKATEGTSTEHDTNTHANHTEDIHPLQMLQLVNTLRPVTGHLPATTPSHHNGNVGKKSALVQSYQVQSRDLQCDMNESLDEIMSETSSVKESLVQEEGEDVAEHRKLRLPRSDIEGLFKTMLAQDVNEGSLFRHEAIYLPPWEVIDCLRRLENDATRLDQWETRICNDGIIFPIL